MSTHLISPSQITSKIHYEPFIGTDRVRARFAGSDFENVTAGDLLIVQDPDYDRGARQVFRVSEISPNPMFNGVFFVKVERPHGQADAISTADRWPVSQTQWFESAPIDFLDEFGPEPEGRVAP